MLEWCRPHSYFLLFSVFPAAIFVKFGDADRACRTEFYSVRISWDQQAGHLPSAVCVSVVVVVLDDVFVYLREEHAAMGAASDGLGDE